MVMPTLPRSSSSSRQRSVNSAAERFIIFRAYFINISFTHRSIWSIIFPTVNISTKLSFKRKHDWINVAVKTVMRVAADRSRFRLYSYSDFASLPFIPVYDRLTSRCAAD